MMERINQLAFYFPFASAVQIGHHGIGFIKIQIKKGKKNIKIFSFIFADLFHLNNKSRIFFLKIFFFLNQSNEQKNQN